MKRDAENMRKLGAYMMRADTTARLAQLEQDDDLAAQVAEAERRLSELRAQLGGEA